VDLNVQDLLDGERPWADMLFISTIAVQRTSAEQIIARCKALEQTVFASGPLFSAEPEKFAEVDHLVLDEAEITLF
jgi:hypothetical protein